MYQHMHREFTRDAETLMDVGSTTPMTTEDEQMSFAWNRKTRTDAVVAALRTVLDPEIPVNIYDLGLIYRIELGDEGHVEIDMTLTAPGCPVAGEILGWVEKAVRGVEGVAKVKVNLVFDPPWDKSRMSEEVKLELGLM
jgi:FeS assembly SUF system protein